MSYAERTTVPISKTIAEIRMLIEKAGGAKYQFGEEEDRIAVGFTRENRAVRFTLRMPPMPNNASAAARQRNDQARRSKVRALLLVIKAKLESVNAGIETFEQAFLANVMMPGGGTVHQHVEQALIDAYTSGRSPPALLPDYHRDRP